MVTHCVDFDKSPGSPLDESLSDLLRVVGLLDGAAALLTPTTTGAIRTARECLLEARAVAVGLRDRVEQWITREFEQQREATAGGAA